jgi:hypothetical protein
LLQQGGKGFGAFAHLAHHNAARVPGSSVAAFVDDTFVKQQVFELRCAFSL